MQKWLITGANGNLGMRLIDHLLNVQNSAGTEVVAVVRSDRAKQSILDRFADFADAGSVESVANEVADAPLSDPTSAVRLTVECIDYSDAAAIARVARGCTTIVHLVGILKATKFASYQQAHEDSCTALSTGLEGSTVKQIIYLSIVGSSAGSSNLCLASKGAAEDILANASTAACILRVPMVLGEGDYASFALRKRAQSNFNIGLRMDSLEQPIYAGDVIAAIIRAGQLGSSGRLDIGGPEVLPRRDLVRRAAKAVGKDTTVLSVPLFLGLTVATLLERMLANPPVTKAMLEVLDHDDDINNDHAFATLDLQQLTPLDDMLEKVLA